MTIFVDMDDVIADAYTAHIEIYNKDFNEQLTLEDTYGKKVWECVPKDRQHSVINDMFRVGFFKDLAVIPDSQKVVAELCKKYDVFIASTATEFPDSLREKSDWLDKFFPFIPWQRRILCGDKHILRGDVLIDDYGYNLESFQGRGIMFTSPHNVNVTGFERADNWKEVAEKLL